MTREDMLERVRKLLAVRVDRGATEAESLSAAAKAAELCIKWGIERHDIQEPEPVKQLVLDMGTPPHPATFAAAAIATFTDTVCAYRIKEENGHAEQSFWGREANLLIAEHLMSVVRRSIDEAQQWWAGGLNQAQARDSYGYGLCVGVSDRLHEMKPRPPPTEAGRALVPMLQQEIHDALVRHGVKFERVQGQRVLLDPMLKMLGEFDSHKVPLNPAIGER
jgi:hypothetical protein